MGLAVLMMMAPTFMMLGGPLQHPMMVDGDKIEQQSCPTCKGTDPKCKRCHGRGQIDFIVPGPQRPTYIIGHVYGPDSAPVAEAAVNIESTAGNINVHTDETGRFGATLPPGSYPLNISSAKGELHQPLVVDKLTQPVPADEEKNFRTEDRPYQLVKP